MFAIGRIYNKYRDIHSRFGGQEQGGIVTPAAHALIFLFTTSSGAQHGYRDGWSKDGVFLFTGEGQRGDMKFTKGNLALSRHKLDGEEVHLFSSEGSGNYRYEGEFVVETWEPGRGPDTEGNDRATIVFHLVPLTDATEVTDEFEKVELPNVAIAELRQLAFQAGVAATEAPASAARRTVYFRSRIVKAYVLARANGICESCQQPAPFQRSDGTSYLEPHHTRRRGDGGPDHPRWVGALCPNCHREIHYGVAGEAKNRQLQSYVAEIEAT